MTTSAVRLAEWFRSPGARSAAAQRRERGVEVCRAGSVVREPAEQGRHAAGIGESGEDQAAREIERLRIQAESIKTSPTSIERVARDELGLVRQTEIVMQFKKD